jgi:hypothetical protein
VAISDTSVLFVEGSSVFVANLNSSPQVSGNAGIVSIVNPVLVYKSTPPGNTSLDATNHADASMSTKVRLPPKMFLSPSGNFVSLFWVSELQYEILHVKSLLGTFQVNGTRAPPLIELGTGIQSFAWVGSDDVFAILRTQAASMAASAMAKPPAPSTNKSGLRFGSKKLKLPSSSKSQAQQQTAASSDVTDDDEIPKEGAVEMRLLVTVNVAAAVTSCAAATGRSIGKLPLRGGQPLHLFGGPVLCVASTHPGSVDASEGLAYFYTRKASDADLAVSELKASSYASVGTSLPLPDLVEWSDDGTHCCMCVGPRACIYLSSAAGFALVGVAQLHQCVAGGVEVESAKFLYGVLYCCTRTSIQVVFLGAINEIQGGLSAIDCYEIATLDQPFTDGTTSDAPLAPGPTTMCLEAPAVLFYLAGNLVISTATGIQSLSLNHPLLRIGTLLAAGHPHRAMQWFQNVERHDFEGLANFLEARGHPDLALGLSGLSIATQVDMSIRWRRTKVLEEIIDEYGLDTIRKVDMGNSAYSAVECIGAVLLAEGKTELVRRLASECVVNGDESRREAFVLASLLLAVDPTDAKRLLKRAVGAKGKVDEEKCWPAANYVRDYVLN